MAGQLLPLHGGAEKDKGREDSCVCCGCVSICTDEVQEASEMK